MGRQQRQILLLTDDFPPDVGGVSTYLQTLYAALPRRTVAVVAPRRADSCAIEDFELQQYGRRRSTLPEVLSMAFAVLRAVIRHRPRALHCSSLLPAGAVALLLKPILGTPYLVHLYGSDVTATRPRAHAAVLSLVLARADRVVAVSDFTRERAIGAGADPARTETLRPPLDITKFRAVPVAPEHRRTLVTVARLVERKGHDVVLRAVAICREQLPDIRYVVVGDGPQRAELERLSVELGIESAVVFTGVVDDVRPYYERAAACVMASRMVWPDQVEGFGIALCEAAACARPVIAGSSGGVSEAVVDQVTGVLVDPANPTELARAILDLLGDPERADRMGRKGREWVATAFDPSRAAARLLEGPGGSLTRAEEGRLSPIVRSAARGLFDRIFRSRLGGPLEESIVTAGHLYPGRLPGSPWLRAVLSRHRRGDDLTVRMRDGALLRVPWAPELLDLYMSGRPPHQDLHRLMRRLVIEGDCVLDVGANVGCYAVSAALRAGPSGRVHALEAQSRLIPYLLSSAELNGLQDRLLVHHAAVDRRDNGTAKLFSVRDRPDLLGVPSLFSHEWLDEGTTEEVPAVSLDGFLDRLGSPRVDVLKLDVEGAELLVLEGFEATLRRSPPPFLIAEAMPSRLRFTSIPSGGGLRRAPGAADPVQLLHHLEHHGFQAHRILAAGHIGSRVTVDELERLAEVANIAFVQDAARDLRPWVFA